jgi:hypothetical protein
MVCSTWKHLDNRIEKGAPMGDEPERPGLDLMSDVLRVCNAALEVAEHLLDPDPELHQPLLEEHPIEVWLDRFKSVREAITKTQVGLIEYIEFKKE